MFYDIEKLEKCRYIHTYVLLKYAVLCVKIFWNTIGSYLLSARLFITKGCDFLISKSFILRINEFWHDFATCNFFHTYDILKNPHAISASKEPSIFSL